MAYQNESYTGLSFTGAEYTVLGSYAPSGPGVYVGSSYTNARYTAEGYTSVNATGGTPFSEAGTSADVDPLGFISGFPFTKEGAAAAVAVATGWGGFNPDPGGILENDSSDEGPLSYTVLTQPGAGTLYAYAGGAFTWDVNVSTPVGRYFWTYGLYVNGVQQGIGTVTMEHGDLFASVDVQGFAGTTTITNAFSEQGIRGTVSVTGFAGDLTLNFNKTGTSAQVGTVGVNASLITGQVLRGSEGSVTPEGFAGYLASNSFNQTGSSASVDVQGYAGTLDVGTFFNEQGTLATVTVNGYSGTLDTGAGFVSTGTAAVISPDGGYGTILFGFAPAGSTGQVTVRGFSTVFSGDLSVNFESWDMFVEQDELMQMDVEPTEETWRMV